MNVFRSLFFVVFVFGIALVDVPVVSAQVVAGDVIRVTNKERAKIGLPPLQQNSTLMKSAQMKARDLMALQYFAHSSLKNRGPFHWITVVSYDYSVAGENLALGYVSAEKVVAGFMRSTGHKANVLHREYREVGVAVIEGTFEAKPAVLVVQHFAARGM